MLKIEIIKKLDCNKGYALIMTALDVSFSTARLYIKDNSDNLTKVAALKAISAEFGIPEKDLIEEKKYIRQ